MRGGEMNKCKKTLDQMFVNMVEQGYECPPFVSNAILRKGSSIRKRAEKGKGNSDNSSSRFILLDYFLFALYNLLQA